jgi:hypothetical protein
MDAVADDPKEPQLRRVTIARADRSAAISILSLALFVE